MLNLPRILARQDAAVLRGTRMAHMAQLPLSYFNARAMSEEEARKAQFEYNLKQSIEEARADARRGPFYG